MGGVAGRWGGEAAGGFGVEIAWALGWRGWGVLALLIVLLVGGRGDGAYHWGPHHSRAVLEGWTGVESVVVVFHVGAEAGHCWYVGDFDRFGWLDRVGALVVAGEIAWLMDSRSGVVIGKTRIDCKTERHRRL